MRPSHLRINKAPIKRKLIHRCHHCLAHACQYLIQVSIGPRSSQVAIVSETAGRRWSACVVRYRKLRARGRSAQKRCSSTSPRTGFERILERTMPRQSLLQRALLNLASRRQSFIFCDAPGSDRAGPAPYTLYSLVRSRTLQLCCAPSTPSELRYISCSAFCIFFCPGLKFTARLFFFLLLFRPSACFGAYS
jgi:hypothetical protein